MGFFFIKISEILTNLNLKKKQVKKRGGGVLITFESCKFFFNKFNIFPTEIKTLIVQCFGFFSSGEEFFHILHEINHNNIQNLIKYIIFLQRTFIFRRQLKSLVRLIWIKKMTDIFILHDTRSWFMRWGNNSSTVC